MKIEQLLELDATPNSPLGRARAAEKAKADAVNPAVGAVPNLGATKGLPQATTNAQPTTLGAPSAAQAKQVPTAPAADATGRVDPTMEPDELADIKKNAGLPVAQEPEQLQGTTADEEPAAPAKPGVLDKFKDKAKAFWDYANTDKSGADAAEFGAGVADAAGSLSRGVQNTVTGAGNLAKGVQPGISQVAQSTGQAASDVGDAVGTAAGGIGRGAKSLGQGIGDVGQGVDAAAQGLGQGVGGIGQGIGRAATGLAKGAQGIGDLAGAVGGAATTAVGGLAGGFKRGYNNQTQGVQSSGGAGSNAIRRVAGLGPSNSGGGGGGGNDELAQLQATIQQMDQRMRKGGL